jgi:diguanylate cyclase (GGDEF)-like protein
VTVQLDDTDVRRLESFWPGITSAAAHESASTRLIERVATTFAANRHAHQLLGDLYAFSRSLALTSDARQLNQLVVDNVAGHVGARQAALALYEERTGTLSVVATRGYPSVLVEDLRIAPGSGVIGEVFVSRRPLLVEDAAKELGMSRRPRYRTSSFMVLPLLGDRQALGVMTFADRTDDHPFTRSDLTVARAFSAPAVLGLATAQMASKAREMARAAAVDALTGLFNRRYFETRIDEEIQRARRYGLDLALLVIDADDFKQLNDTFGHPAGDRVLRAMSDTLRRSVRAFDVCTRFGGEEFAILMPGSNAASAVQSADRIRQRVANYRFDPLVVPAHVHPTISVGVAVLNGDQGTQDLIARADRALYTAKAEGKNCVRIAHE